jgi:short-subunit dehydrogenase
MSDLFDVGKEIILITGASQGLGRQFARVLAAHGAAVVLAARQATKLKALEEEIRSRGGRAAAVQMDVTDIASIGTAVDAAEAAFGPVSVLINNAGIAIDDRPDRGGLGRRHQRQSQGRVFPGDRDGAADDRTQAGRNIVNIASVLGTVVMKFLAPYAISKDGVIGRPSLWIAEDFRCCASG